MGPSELSAPGSCYKDLLQRVVWCGRHCRALLVRSTVTALTSRQPHVHRPTYFISAPLHCVLTLVKCKSHLFSYSERVCPPWSWWSRLLLPGASTGLFSFYHWNQHGTATLVCVKLPCHSCIKGYCLPCTLDHYDRQFLTVAIVTPILNHTPHLFLNLNTDYRLSPRVL